MAIQSEIRKSDLYVGNGSQKTFTFAFKLLAASDAEVRVAPADGEETTLATTAYTCTLNEDQDNQPGGSITLLDPLEDGATLVIISAEAALQPTVFTNRGAFYPTVLNTSLDRLTILIQQILEQLSRAVMTDVTDTMTSSELKKKLVNAAETATVIAKGYADQAQESAEQAKASEEKTAEYAEAATIVAPIADEVKTVAGAIDAVSTVSTNIEAVKTVAENVETVAPIAGEIKTVAGAVTDVQTVSANIDAVKTVADNVGVVAPIAGEIKTVAGAVNAVNTVSANIDAVVTVADNAKTIVDSAEAVKTVATNIADVKTVSGIAKDVSTVANNAEEITAVGKNIDDVHDAAQLLPHVDDIGAIKGHLDEVHKVGQDLLGVNSSDFDCGEIGDELDPITTIVDGYIKKVAEHIDDCIHPVGENLDTLKIVANNLSPVNEVAEVMTTDFEKIFNEGVS